MLSQRELEKQLAALEGEETEEDVSVEQPAARKLDKPISEDLSSQLDDIESSTIIGNDIEETSVPVSSTDEVAITEVDESPEGYYLRTGEVPSGYKLVPTVPTGDRPEDRIKLEPISAPKQTVSEQTAAAFDYDKTKELTAALYGDENIDILGVDEFVKEKVPEPLQGAVKLLGNMLNKDIANLAIAVKAVSETAEDVGTELTRTIHDTFTEENTVFGMTGKELLPFTPETAGKKFGADLAALLEMAEATPAVGSLTGLAGTAAKKAADKPFKEAIEEVQKKARGEATRKKLDRKKLRIQRAQLATEEEIAKKAAEAKKVAAENEDIAQELIRNFENRTGKTISSETPEGKLVLDGEKARKAGIETAEQIAEDNRSTVRKYLATDVSQTDAALLAGLGEEITQPLLKAEKFDGLVASIAELKKSKPDAFKPKRFTNPDGTQGKEYGVIDHLFELTVNEELLPGDELIDVLNKYNISFEDYILTVVGSGSEAGKVLQKLSQIKRMRPANEMIAMQEAATKEAAGRIRKTGMRIENVRRGGLVSQLATASRNLQSGAIRAPLEGLGNVMDTALYNLSEEGAVAAAKSLGSFNNWKDSFRHMKYMFGPETRLDVEDYTNFILGQPELAAQYDLMFNNLNEIQKLTGRGSGGVGDKILTELEDAVDVLNTPNRWQEFLIRRGAFLGELERLTKREYGIDLIDAINDGKIRDLLNDASTVRPEGARSFNDIVADATNRALDVTYAKQPDVPIFRSASQFITRNGLTVVLPFPRWMFNSMELMGQYAGGASIPLARKVASAVTRGKVGKGKLTRKDRERISRNLVGSGTVPFIFYGDEEDGKDAESNGVLDTVLDYASDMLLSMSIAGAAYQYRTSEDAPADYKLLKTGENTVMDVTPQYPVRQFMYIGEATKMLQKGTFDDWFKPKEFAETFLGTNIRQGVGQSLLQEVADLAAGTDLTSEEQAGRILGRTLGNYLSTWAVPFAQIVEAERAAGMRGLQYKDTAEDPTLDFQTSFMQNLSRPFARFESAEKEAARPKREFLFAEEKSRVLPLFRVLGGINLATVDEEYGEYIGQFGYTDFELGSKSKVGSIRRFENKVVRDALPDIVDSAKRYEKTLRNRYKISSDKVKEEFTEEKFVSSRIRSFIKKKIKNVRDTVSDKKTLTADAPAYAESMLKYRRLSKETRAAAAVQFVEKYERQPDGTDMKDLYRLLQIGKAYDKAMK
jgi:hypothetical protein